MATSIVPIRTALYYPYPIIQSDGWLALAALFWDSLFRIVPEGFRYMDIEDRRVRQPSLFAQALIQGCDFLKDYSLDYGRSPTSPLAHAGAGLIELMETLPEYFSLMERAESQYFTWGLHEYYKGGTDAITERLQQLGAFSEHRKLRFARPPHSLRFWDLPGRVYMALLAKYLSELHGLPVVTDDANHDKILFADMLAPQSRRYEYLDRAPVPWPKPIRPLGLPGPRKAWDFALCELTFSGIGVRGLESVPAKTILQIRERYDAERRVFFDEIHATVAVLADSGAESGKFIEEFLHDRAQALTKARNDYAKAISGMKLQTFFTLLKTSFTLPIVDTLAAHFSISKPLSLEIAAAAGALGITGVLHQTHLNQVKERLAKPTAFYLYTVSKIR
jgi:hypothetical protein